MAARYDFRTKRIFVEPHLDEGLTIETDRAQANYLLNVLRLREGADVLLFNGKDGEWLAKLMPMGRKSCGLVLQKQLRPQPDQYDLHYYFAPLKQVRLDYMMQKAVEMGVGRLVPVITEYTQMRIIKQDKIHANLVEAAEQCGILAVPQLEPKLKLEELIATWPTINADRTLIFCDELSGNTAMSGKPANLSAINTKSVAVLIGPEGGFSADERELLRAQTFVHTLSLGPRILRADTAAVAALTLVQAFIGDLR